MEPNVNQAPVAPVVEQAPQPAPAYTPGIANAPVVAQPVEQPPVQQPAAEPVNPAPQPAPQPTADPAPQPVANPEPVKSQTYDEYLDSLTADFKPVELPKPSDVNQEDPEGLVKFFNDLTEKTVEKAKQEYQKEQVVQRAEAIAWNEVFTKYPEVQQNPQLRDTIHNIRMGAYSRGESLSPIQAADSLVSTLHAEYKKGINDTNVQTRVQESQPLHGGGQPQPEPTVNYEALQDGGRDAAVLQLQRMIENGQI